jgi:hypothetical protein
LNYVITIGDVIVKNNALLSNLPEFNSLTNVGDFQISDNPLLKIFSSMPSVSTMKSLIINNNPLLLLLPPFENLTILGDLVISNSSFSVLPPINVTTIRDFIIDSTLLTTILGFTSLTSIRKLYILNNSVLVKIPNFDSVNIGLTIVRNNPLLIFP